MHTAKTEIEQMPSASHTASQQVVFSLSLTLTVSHYPCYTQG